MVKGSDGLLTAVCRLRVARPGCFHRTGEAVVQRWHARRQSRSISTEVSQTTISGEPQGAWHHPSDQESTASGDSHLDPSPDSYSSTPFADKCTLTVKAGSGGHGCISFLREKFIPDGPANGGDGGTGGSIYIQAVKGETSLHKLARRGIIAAGRGQNGLGKGRGGQRGEDILIQVPVGTTIREISRRDPLEEQLAEHRKEKAFGRDAVFDGDEDDGKKDQVPLWRRDKWLLYPGALPKSFTTADFPALPRPRRSNLSASQLPAPIRLDLESPMDTPMLLAAGALGGLGNPHFVTKSITKPKFATKGDSGMSLQVQLELKLLADVGLVGLPNAGKSTLLRSLTRSRARVGNWAFTTLQPNVGTVVLDDHKGRAGQMSRLHVDRESFTIADIPGLVEDAHLDRGLGLGFLRHVERAGVLAFVVDLSSEDAVKVLKSLWKEVSMFESFREQEVHAETERRRAAQGVPPARDALSDYEVLEDQDSMIDSRLSLSSESDDLSKIELHSISSKPWMVVATKADLSETQDHFRQLANYLRSIEQSSEMHPSGRRNAWRRHIQLVPVSAIRGEGVERIIPAVLEMIDGSMREIK